MIWQQFFKFVYSLRYLQYLCVKFGEILIVRAGVEWLKKTSRLDTATELWSNVDILFVTAKNGEKTRRTSFLKNFLLRYRELVDGRREGPDKGNW